MVVKKLKTEIKIAVVIIVLSMVVILAIVFIARINSNLNKGVSLAETQIKEYRKTMGEDVGALIESQESLKYELEQEYNKIKKFLSKSNLKVAETAAALSFKKLLFEVQERISDKAKRKNVSLPQDLGFAEYKLLVPDDSHAPVLMSELVILEEISSLLIKNKVYALRNIKLPHKIMSISKKMQDATEVSFRSLSMQLSIETDFKQLKKFLLDLAGSDKTYVVRQIDIKKLDETSDRLVADININSLEL